MRYLLEEARQNGQPETAYLQTVLEYTRSLNSSSTLSRKKMSRNPPGVNHAAQTKGRNQNAQRPASWTPPN